MADVFGEEPLNQSTPYVGRNLYSSDPLIVALAALLPEADRNEISKLGMVWGTADSFQLAHLANRHEPILKTHDAQGRRVDQVDFHPAYHALMRRSVKAGLQGSIWDGASLEQTAQNHHLSRAVRFYLTAQVECGHLCPLTMTNAAPAALRHHTLLLNEWLPRVRSRNYDPAQKPAAQKVGVTIGMAMTEKQGGSHVSTNLTRADRTHNNTWLITGHKWFMSAPMCDAFFVLAQTPAGLSCFFVPRFLPDGRRNKIRLQRLKDKLGNRSNASSEVEFHGAESFIVGAEGHGVRTILEMVTLTRLDCAVASAGIMRSALGHAVHHMRERTTPQAPLIDHALANRVLADMALDSAAATVLSMRLAEAFDQSPHNGTEALFARLMTPVVKYWVCKATPMLVTEAMECMGGNGYIEDWPMPRFYREAPVNAIWEGSGNIMCLDVLRVLRSNPEALDAVLAIVQDVFGVGQTSVVDVVKKAALAALNDEGSARLLTEQLALTVAAGELRRITRTDIADAFLEARLGSSYATTYGMLDGRFDARAMLDAMYPYQG